ncbi:MAG: hypothetical protein IKY94_10665 [Lachnospiraceae bacterium]|nr:hypothetical protein [Lachnospiraceae bacterium]
MGTFGFFALNIPDTVIDKPDELCAPVCRFQGTLTAEQTEEYKHEIPVGRITPVLELSLQEYKASITQFALELDVAESYRTLDGLVELSSRYFLSAFKIAENNTWIL